MTFRYPPWIAEMSDGKTLTSSGFDQRAIDENCTTLRFLMDYIKESGSKVASFMFRHGESWIVIPKSSVGIEIRPRGRFRETVFVTPSDDIGGDGLSRVLTIGDAAPQKTTQEDLYGVSVISDGIVCDLYVNQITSDIELSIRKYSK
jgi:hypothetical protein